MEGRGWGGADEAEGDAVSFRDKKNWSESLEPPARRERERGDPI